MSLHAILFDLDGTLIDTNDLHVEAWYEALTACGFQVPLDRLRIEIGKGGDIMIPMLLGQDTERAQGDSIRRAHKLAFASRLDDNQVKWLPGAKTALCLARNSGVQIALATSTSREDLTRLERHLNTRFDRLFDVVTTSDEAAASKPEPDVLQVACKELGLDPLACAMVGDSIHDGLAARRAGLSFLGVTTGYATSGDLHAEGARHVVSDLQEFIATFPELVTRLWPSHMDVQPDALEEAMDVAIDAAREGFSKGEVPIGAALFDREGQLLATGHNSAMATGDISAHAEMVALRNLSKLGHKIDAGTMMVSTLEPCVMCLGAAMMVGIDIVLYGLRAPADGGSSRVSPSRSPENQVPRVRGGIGAAESRSLFQEWLDRGGTPAQKPYVEQLLAETPPMLPTRRRAWKVTLPGYKRRSG